MRINHKVVSDHFDNEVVIVNLESGAYYSMKDTALAIWSLFEKNVSREGIINSFKGLTEVQKEEMLGFLSLMVSEGLAETSEVEIDSDIEDLVFYKLTYSKFDDMADLIMIDPIHEADETKGWPNKAES